MFYVYSTLAIIYTFIWKKYGCTLDDIVEKVVLGLVVWKFFCMRTFSFVGDMVISREVRGFGGHIYGAH